MCVYVFGSASLKPSAENDLPHKKANRTDSARAISMGEEEEAEEGTPGGRPLM